MKKYIFNMSHKLVAMTHSQKSLLLKAIIPFQSLVQHRQPRSQHDEHTSVTTTWHINRQVVSDCVNV